MIEVGTSKMVRPTTEIDRAYSAHGLCENCEEHLASVEYKGYDVCSGCRAEMEAW